MRVIDGLEEFYLSMEGVVSPKTLEWYQQKLQSFSEMYGRSKLGKIKTSDLEKWRAYLSRKSTRFENHPSKPTIDGGLTMHTIHGHVRACQRFFKWCYEEKKIIKSNPAAAIKKTAVTKKWPAGNFTI